MINKSKFKYQGRGYPNGKLTKMPTEQQENKSLLIKKDKKQTLPKMQSDQRLRSHDSSFRSESRKKIIRNIYTPSQKDQLDQSIRKMQSFSSRHSLNNSSNQFNINNSNNKSQFTRKQSAKQQVRMIQNNVTPKDKDQQDSLKNLSKLVDYNLYKNQSSNGSRSRLFDSKREKGKNLSINTSQSILKPKYLQNTSSTTKNSYNHSHTQQRSFNQPLFSDRPNPVEINGSSACFHSKSCAQHPYNSNIKIFRYGKESVQLKGNKITRQMDQPRYKFADRIMNTNYETSKLPYTKSFLRK